ncbi:PaaI family thioesterase [Nocardia sp. NPDC005366]|uniref:PaaI family thioesterase n=1 Tax=Nocardia sp. NPDC005366 TaxID=3156878 RepID=UPI0033A69E44
MSEQQVGAALPSAEHHEGGFRPMMELIEEHASDTTRGGPHFGALIEQVRTLMDRARLACPSDQETLEVIGILEKLNDKLDASVVDEWSSPTWTRHDLPGRGNITLPPFTVDRADRDGVDARVTFRTFHLGGNAAAHGGQIAIALDELLGMAAAVHAGGVTRTASLTIDYRSITPLNTELRVHSWAERQEGRKVYVRATLHAGERLCAEANGLFIVLKPGQQ